MATLSVAEIASLLRPYGEYSGLVLEQLSVYLDLLVKWNARTNLTAIRDPKQMVARHFGESLFASRYLPAGESLLDFGSGAGFPGLPMQLARPELRVTLAESQNKKASFLREVVRSLGLTAEVWGARVDAMPAERRFDVVTLRAVDNPGLAIGEAGSRIEATGAIVHLTTGIADGVRRFAMPGIGSGVVEVIPAAECSTWNM
jgi:16S rRNA (guanine527-N7)-methyltransferase